MTSSPFSVTDPLHVGLIGTGYAARLRAEALKADSRAVLRSVAGHELSRTEEFSHAYGAEAIAAWPDLLQQAAIDVVIIATINCDHGAIVRAALNADKHVIVEYPLSLDVTDAEELIALAKSRNKLLHVEHIELLGGVHQAVKATLPQIGSVFHARYATIKPERPAPQRWTYHQDQFGFPLIGALSRVHRLTDLFGAVTTVSCQAQYWDAAGAITTGPMYATALCTAHLRFEQGQTAEVIYGKGEALWRSQRLMEIHGVHGALILDGEQGTLIRAEVSQPIEVGSRRGLFAKDTAMVLDHLVSGSPLYVTPEASLYTLRVADAARRSAETGQTITLNSVNQ